ncbi:DUF262 domain-containing protein [Nocardioides zeae]
MANAQEVRLPAVIAERMLEIPDYQRPYAWREKQLSDLWEDLDLLGPRNSHYAGTLVLRDITENGVPKTSMADDGSTLRHCEVVDGQQRLTTCLLLLDRIRRRLEKLADHGVEHAASMAAMLRSKYGTVSIGNAHQPRLRLGAGLNDYWVNITLGSDNFVGPRLVSGEERLRDAAAFFDAKLATLQSSDRSAEFARLKDLQGRVTAGLGFLVYEVQSLAEVGVIFETLNERGRALSDLEKTKNYLLYLARSIEDDRANELAGRINKAWADIFANIAGQARDADDQLLRAHWLATVDPSRREWKQIASIKANFDRSNYISGATRIVPTDKPAKDQDDAWDRLFHDLSGYIDGLRKCSFFLREMFDGTADLASFDSHRDETRRVSAALLRSGVVAPYRPLLFAARLRYPNDGEFYSQLVALCEKYSARVFVIRQRRLNAGEARLLRLAHELYSTPQDDDRRAWILREVAAVIWRYASDNDVRATMESTDENWYARRGHKYFLYEYELDIRQHAQELPPLSYFTAATGEQRTTEHVLPQHPAKDDGCWWDHFTEAEHANLVHSLGNLALTYDNSSYGRKCFSSKRGVAAAPGAEESRCYAQAELKQERQLAHHDHWTPEVIEKRQLAFAAWALERWSVPSPSPAELTEDVEIEAEDDAAEIDAPESDD